MKHTIAILATVLATGCASTSVVQSGERVTFASSKAPEALIQCVHDNAQAGNNIMLTLLFKRTTAPDGGPRLIIDRPLNNFAVIDAKPSGAGSSATLYLGFAALSRSYVTMMTKGCA